MKKNSENLEVALFNTEVENNADNIVELLNTHLDDKNKVKNDDIESVKDIRDKKGPVLIKFKSIGKKINVLKAKNDHLIVHDSLSKDKIKLRKKAVELKAKKLISNVWIYRGEVYYSLPDSEDQLRASYQAFQGLESCTVCPSDNRAL